MQLFSTDLPIHRILVDRNNQARRGIYWKVLKHILEVIDKANHLVKIFKSQTVFEGKFIFNNTSLKEQLNEWSKRINGFLILQSGDPISNSQKEQVSLYE